MRPWRRVYSGRRCVSSLDIERADEAGVMIMELPPSVMKLRRAAELFLRALRGPQEVAADSRWTSARQP